MDTFNLSKLLQRPIGGKVAVDLAHGWCHVCRQIAFFQYVENGIGGHRGCGNGSAGGSNRRSGICIKGILSSDPGNVVIRADQSGSKIIQAGNAQRVGQLNGLIAVRGANPDKFNRTAC